MTIYNEIFRAVKAKTDIKRPQSYLHTMRPPGNVPYIVDNLWEWKRPVQYPNRRYSAFASPTQELALLSAGKDAIAYKVNFLGNYKLCQLMKNKDFNRNEDSKHHPDCTKLRRLLLNRLSPQWVDKELHAKSDIGRLWIPCLRKGEVDALFETIEALKNIRQEIFDAITYWDDVALISQQESIPDNEGEVFFEAFDGYYLSPL
jgi:hypothetical protein